MRIRSQKNFGTGLMLIGFAGIFLWKSFDYRLGTAAVMGPGYFPMLLAIMLMVIGAVVLVKGLAIDGPTLEPIPWKPLLIITFSTVAFGLLLMRGGLIISLFVLLLASATASTQYRFNWRVVAAGGLLIAFCCAVFVYGLGIPLPLLGSWF